ncbi:hypothetical protein [Nocardioides alcanivorans]|uniref:hypothetical protein n=1 Tax=Nocardioides alcanivorans TaxID=2897352 RepID=UPI001F3B415D|nr:hypothetical protein [Nocardioides alcanivorans]
MNKLIFALLAPAESSAAAIDTALSPALRERVAAAGASRIQVNVVDAAFAAAHNIQTLAEPIIGTVGVWYDTERSAVADAVVSVLTDAGITHHAWEIDEREPLPGPEVADGERVSALANIAFLRKPVDLPYEEWRSIWQDSHTQIAIDTQDTFGYVQNRVTEAITPSAPPVVAIVEELFHEAAAGDWHVFYGSDGDNAELKRRMGLMRESCDRFGANRGLDLVSTARRSWTLG